MEFGHIELRFGKGIQGRDRASKIESEVRASKTGERESYIKGVEQYMIIYSGQLRAHQMSH